MVGVNIGAAFQKQNVVTGSRAIDGTIYRNTSGKTMFISVVGVYSAGNPTITGYSDASATPTTEIGTAQNTDAGSTVTLSFMVLNNHYYKITSVQASLSTWIEWV